MGWVRQPRFQGFSPQKMEPFFKEKALWTKFLRKNKVQPSQLKRVKRQCWLGGGAGGGEEGGQFPRTEWYCKLFLTYSPLWKRERNWDELTFAKTPGTVTRDRRKKLANSWPWRVPRSPRSKRFCAVSEPRARNESHFSSFLGLSLPRNYTETLVMQANASTDKQ